MTRVELLLRVAVYLLSGYSLALAASALTSLALPSSARMGVRLLAVLVGQWALCAILVQTLGLLGLLRAPGYLAASLLLGLAVTWLLRARQPQRSLWRLLCRGLRLWIVAPAGGLGIFTLLCLPYLAARCLALPQDIDSLSLHGPMIVDWVQSGRVSLATHFNYPQCWEYQFVPGFLFLGGDGLIVLPALAAVLGLLLAVRELAARLRLGGALGHQLSLLAVTLPVVWRGAFKNDPAVAVAMLLGILALERLARGRQGGFWLLQLAAFLALGTKATGFVNVALLVGLCGAAVWLRPPSTTTPRARMTACRIDGRRPVRGAHDQTGTSAGRRLAWLPAAGATLLLQGTAAAMQLHNLVANGSPVHPLQVRLGAWVLLPGPADLSGTSILEHLREPEAWRQLVVGAGRVGGLEWPLLVLALAWGLAASGRRLRQAWRVQTWPASGQLPLLAAPWITCLLWQLFVATPWTAGLEPGSLQYLSTGTSLRFAIAPSSLSYLVAGTATRRWLAEPIPRLLLAFGLPLAIGWKWRHLAAEPANRPGLWWLLTLWAILTLLAAAAARWSRTRRPRGSRTRSRAGAAVPVAWVAASLLLVVFMRQVEGDRALTWCPPYRDVWTHVWSRLPPGSTIAVTDPRARYSYVLLGPRFDNRLLLVPIGRGDRGDIPLPIDHAYVSTPPAGPALPTILDHLLPRGWRIVAVPDDGRGALLERLSGPTRPTSRVGGP